MAQDYVNRSKVDNDYEPSDRNQQAVVSNLANLTGLLSGLYQTNSLQNAIACSTAHPSAFVLCPNGIVINGMLVATPDQDIQLSFNRENGYLTLTVDGRIASTIALGETFATKTEMEAADAVLDAKIDDLLSASQAMVTAGTINASTGKLTSVNTTLFGTTGTDWTTISFSEIPRYIKVKAGWTFRVVTAGSVMGYGDSTHYEVGDQIQITTDIAKSSTAYITPSQYTAIQNNVDVATANALGLVKVPSANGLSVDSNGNVKIGLASASAKGVVQVPSANGLSVDANGNVKIGLASTSAKGVVQIKASDGLAIDSSGILSLGTMTMTLSVSADKATLTISIGSISKQIEIPLVSSTTAGLMSPNDKSRLDNTAMAYFYTGASLESIYDSASPSVALVPLVTIAQEDNTLIFIKTSDDEDFKWVELQRSGYNQEERSDGRGYIRTQSYYAIITEDGKPYIYTFDITKDDAATTASFSAGLQHKDFVYESEFVDKAQFNYRSTAGSFSIVDKADGDVAKIKALYGDSLVWNQLIDMSTISKMDSQTILTKSINNGWYRVENTTGESVTIQRFQVRFNHSIIKNHKYYIFAQARFSGVTKNDSYDYNVCGYAFKSGNSTQTDYITIDLSKVNTLSDILLANDDYSETRAILFIRRYASEISEMSLTIAPNGYGEFRMQAIDLSLMFGLGKEPTLVEFETFLANYFPRHDYAYNEGEILSIKSNGIKTIGFNLWDEEWEVGSIEKASGQNMEESSRIRSKNFIKVLPNQLMNFRSTLKDTIAREVFFYDANKNFISYNEWVNTFTTPSNCYYIRFRCGQISEPQTSNPDICINLVWSGKRNGEYEEHWSETTPIPITTLKGKKSDGTVEVMFPDGLCGIGDYKDEIKGNKAIKRIGRVDLGSLDWRLHNADYGIFAASLAHLNGGWYNISLLKSSKYPTASPSQADSTGNKTIRHSGGDNEVRIQDLSYTDAAALKASLQGVYAYYVLGSGDKATPVEYTLDQEFKVDYKVDDYGTEEILPENGIAPTSLPIIADIEYGVNIPDTLSRLHLDYVSVHKQELSELEQEQARQNIDAVSHEELAALQDDNMHFKGYLGYYFPAQAATSPVPTVFIGRQFTIDTYNVICDMVDGSSSGLADSKFALLEIGSNNAPTGNYVVYNLRTSTWESVAPSSLTLKVGGNFFVDGGGTVVVNPITLAGISNLAKGDTYFVVSDYQDYKLGDLIICKEYTSPQDNEMVRIPVSLTNMERLQIFYALGDLTQFKNEILWIGSYRSLNALITALNNAGIGNIQSITINGVALTPDAQHSVDIPLATSSSPGVVRLSTGSNKYSFNSDTQAMSVTSTAVNDATTLSDAAALYNKLNTRITNLGTSLEARIAAIEQALTWQAYPQS